MELDIEKMELWWYKSDHARVYRILSMVGGIMGGGVDVDAYFWTD